MVITQPINPICFAHLPRALSPVDAGYRGLSASGVSLHTW